MWKTLATSLYEKPQKRVLKARVLEIQDASIICSFVTGQLTKFLAYYSYLERVSGERVI